MNDQIVKNFTTQNFEFFMINQKNETFLITSGTVLCFIICGLCVIFSFRRFCYNPPEIITTFPTIQTPIFIESPTQQSSSPITIEYPHQYEEQHQTSIESPDIYRNRQRRRQELPSLDFSSIERRDSFNNFQVGTEINIISDFQVGVPVERFSNSNK